MRKGLLGALVPLSVLVWGAIPALAANLRVAPRQASFGCAQTAQYYSIQSAVTAAKPGDQITVCPGTYQEQVTINKPNIMLQSQQPLQATIKAPNASSYTILSITATGVKVQGFTITGAAVNQSASCTDSEYGVYVSGGGSADLEQDDISDIGQSPVSGCQQGVAVRAGSNALSTTGSVTLKNSTIEGYQKGGVVVDGPGSSGDIENDSILGIGPTTQIAGNGIQISRAATGTVKNDTVSNNIYVGGQPPQPLATGILLYCSGSVTVQSNTVSTNDYGIDDASAGDSGNACNTSTSPSKIMSNTVTNSTADGVVLDGENGAQLTNSQVAGTWGNSTYGSDTGDGVDVYDTTGSQVQNNQSAGNSEDGIHNESNSTGNTYTGNQASTNHTYDCEDDAMVLNTWNNDQGDVNLPQSICKGNPAVATSTSTPSASALAAPSNSSSAQPAVSPAV